MEIYTIGFTKHSAERFFTRLRECGVKRLVDVRLNNVSQLAGFAKRDDLRYFAKIICNIDYVHLPSLAPTKDLLDSYKKLKGNWQVYESTFLELMRIRRIEETIPRELIDSSCLLCSEERPQYCHRRLVAEYLRSRWDGVDIKHLV